MKKLFLFLFPAFILLSSLSLGQNALAATCVAPNQCKEIWECTTTSNPADNCTGTKLCCEASADTCTSEHQGYSCVDSTGLTDCISGLCPGAANIKCCKPKSSGGTASPTGTVGGGGSTVDINPNDLSPVGDTDIPTLIGTLIRGALGIVGSIALLMFVYGGFILLYSQGDSTKITKGKTILIWATVGVLFIFGSYVFVSYVVTELNQNNGGGGAGGAQVCGQGSLAGYSCMDKSTGTGCVTKLCPGGANNQCCKAKP